MKDCSSLLVCQKHPSLDCPVKCFFFLPVRVRACRRGELRPGDALVGVRDLGFRV